MPPVALRFVLPLAALACALGLAVAQEKNSAPILHEDIKVPASQLAKTSARLKAGVPIIGDAPQAQKNPTAIASQGKLLASPQDNEQPRDEEPIFGEPKSGKKNFGGTRQQEARADYATSAEGTLEYIEIFNPSIVPFKRMSAMNAITANFTLISAGATQADLQVGGRPSPGYDLFWGSIMVDLRPGRDVPIPSVAPEMSILSYETTPKTSLIFSKDTADNFYLRSEETNASGRFRVKFLVEANPEYFAPTLPLDTRVKEIPSTKLQPIPSNVRQVAEGVLRDLHLRPGMRIHEALQILTGYFRAFDAKAPPPKSGNIYIDLYKSQAGVCRHRAFAFMITANALGIPTRYLTNEAHAWVEVWLPSTSWIRIDLGGAALALSVRNASDKAMYRPRGEDPFAKPRNYQENYTRLTGDVRGLRQDQIAERQTPYRDQQGNRSGNGSVGGESSSPRRNKTETETERGGNDVLVGPGTQLQGLVEENASEKTSTRATIIGVSPEGYRGESIAVKAKISTGRGFPIAGLKLSIFLAPKGHEGNDSRLVGQGRSNEEGLALVQVMLPVSLDTRRYEVFVTFDGDERYLATASD